MGTEVIDKPAQFIKEPYSDDRLLSPIERIAEILFGLIMALSFTCAFSVFEADRVEVKEMLIGAIGCNIAWGIIDAIMYLMIEISQRGRNRAIVNYVRETSDTQKAGEYIAETLSPEIAEVMGKQGLENIRMAIIQTERDITRTGISGRDLKTSLGIFLLVFLSTFPVALPFSFISSVHVALRVS